MFKSAFAILSIVCGHIGDKWTNRLLGGRGIFLSTASLRRISSNVLAPLSLHAHILNSCLSSIPLIFTTEANVKELIPVRQLQE